MSNTEQKIQAPTTNTLGLMATPAVPCILAGQATRPRIKPDATAPLALADHITATKGPDGLARLAAALPAIVDKAMQDTLPHRYTPALAAAIAEDVIARLTATSTEPTPCPDGVAWCDGDPLNHNDTDDHRHQGAEHTLNGSYLCDPSSEGIATFYLAKWRDSQPHLVFQGTGLWADIDLTQVDELIGDAVPWLINLISTRRRLAIELKPSRVPFAESEDTQTKAAAFELATRAMDVALAKTDNRAGTLRALRTWLDMAEAEQA